MIESLEWTELPAATTRAIVSQVVGIDTAALPTFIISAKAAPLSFYERWRLVRLQAKHRAGRKTTTLEDLFALWNDDERAVLLDGSSAPVHETNEAESLNLDPANALDYVRFFFFAVRGGDGPFILFEDPPWVIAAGMEAAAQEASPVTPAGVDEEGRMLFDATVIYTATSFKTRLAVQSDGQIEMTDDQPLTVGFPMAIAPMPPPLGLGPGWRALMEGIAPTPTPGGGQAAKSKRQASSRPPLVEMVELLLERALLEQSQNRLLGYFNAALGGGGGAVHSFAALMKSSSPVVVVESTIPFVEEAIVQVVNDLLPEGERLDVRRGSVGQDMNGQEVLTDYQLPGSGPAVVLIPFQVYRRVMFVERLAFDIAANDLGAIITCERFEDLPESLRRHADLVLRLPSLDEATFASVFNRVIGGALPRAWRTGASQWIKLLLHTDFEHPRRMRLSPADAFQFVRGQVSERLGAVDPGTAMSLKDLHGLGEARQFAEDLIADIHAALKGKLPWAQVDRGALLVGPPGTGKTTLARAIAKDCGVKFIQGSAASWMAEGVSLGPHISAIRRTFSEARRYAPSIVFIDEIDSLGSREEISDDRNSVYQTEVINAVLEQIQGLDPSAPVFVIGATNHEERVDPALRRSGRLDRVIHIPRPNAEALRHIFQHYLRSLGPDVEVPRAIDTRTLAGLSVGLTGADVERIVRGAARRARKAGRPLADSDLIAEVTNKPRGSAESLRLTPAELQRTAVHEAGHALASYLGPSKGAEIGYVTVVPRDDGTLGFVAHLPDERLHLTRGDYEDRLVVFLAGRAAEELTYGADQVSSGASRDLRSATTLVGQMVTGSGLAGNGKLLWSDTMTEADRANAEGIVANAYDRALRRLRANEAKLAALAAELVARQELSGNEVRAILKRRVATRR